MGLYSNNKYGRKTRWDLPDRESEEWNKFNDELGEKMRGVGLFLKNIVNLPRCRRRSSSLDD